MNEVKRDIRIQRVAGRLHRVVPVLDAAGKVIHYAVSPLKVELRRRDVMQIMIGSGVLAVPVAFTEETWQLGSSLPLRNILILGAMSVVFISAFAYFSFYRGLLRQHVFDYVKRVLSIYLLSLVVVGSLLTIIEMAPWRANWLLALKRTIIVGFPASMSAAVSDAID